jgi:hypothetical protein
MNERPLSRRHACACACVSNPAGPGRDHARRAAHAAGLGRARVRWAVDGGGAQGVLGLLLCMPPGLPAPRVLASVTPCACVPGCVGGPVSALSRPAAALPFLSGLTRVADTRVRMCVRVYVPPGTRAAGGGGRGGHAAGAGLRGAHGPGHGGMWRHGCHETPTICEDNVALKRPVCKEELCGSCKPMGQVVELRGPGDT